MAVAACVCVLCVRDREREIRWDESRQLQWPWVKGIGEMSAAGACALVRLCLKVRERLAREKRVKHRNVMYIVTEDGGRTVLPVPLKSTGALHLLKHHCVTIHCASSCQRHFYQDGYPQNYTLFCPRVRICHMSKAAPLAEYFTQLSSEERRLFLASEEERPFV